MRTVRLQTIHVSVATTRCCSQGPGIGVSRSGVLDQGWGGGGGGALQCDPIHHGQWSRGNPPCEQTDRQILVKTLPSYKFIGGW